MIYKDATLISAGKHLSDKALIKAVARCAGFFEMIDDEWSHGSSYLSANELIKGLMASEGGTIIISAGHQDFDALERQASLVWSDGALYELEIFGRDAGFCVECRGELEDLENGAWQTCFDCQYRIIEDVPIGPRALSSKFVDRMAAWNKRH